MSSVSHQPGVRRRIGRTTLLVASLAALASVACSGVAQASTLPTLSIAITSSSATVSGPLQSGGVNIVTTDTGVKEAAVILFALKPGVTVAEAEAFVKAGKVKHDPNNTRALGSIVFDAEANPTEKGEAQTNLAPGQYLVLVGAGEAEAQIRTSFTVTASPTPAVLPAPQAKIRTIEFGFRGPSTLHDGELVGFENEGFLVHMNVAFPVKNMASAKKVVKALLSGHTKGLEKLIVGPPGGFAGPLSPGGYQQETITAKPGIYVEACFMTTEDGREHTRLGMERIIKITK
jgi:hypothetical protein